MARNEPGVRPLVGGEPVLKPTLRQVVEAWAEECLNTDNTPSLDTMHTITWAKTKLPALVEVLEKAGFRN